MYFKQHTSLHDKYSLSIAPYLDLPYFFFLLCLVIPTLFRFLGLFICVLLNSVPNLFSLVEPIFVHFVCKKIILIGSSNHTLSSKLHSKYFLCVLSSSLYDVGDHVRKPLPVLRQFQHLWCLINLNKITANAHGSCATANQYRAKVRFSAKQPMS